MACYKDTFTFPHTYWSGVWMDSGAILETKELSSLNIS
jgi:hypothetical protein